MTKTIKTDYSRTLEVATSGDGTYMGVRDMDLNKEISTFLTFENAAELGTALLEATGKQVNTFDDLPEVTQDNDRLRAGACKRYVDTKPDEVLGTIKGLLAIHKELVKRQEEADAARKAEEEKTKARADRRDKLAKDLSNCGYDYWGAAPILREAIDRIIELEDAAKS